MSEASMSLQQALERYPYEIEESERGAYFDDLVKGWPAPELVCGIATWRSDCLLPLLEAAQASSTLSAQTTRAIHSVAWLTPADDRGEDDQDRLLRELADAGKQTKLVSEVAGALEIPRFEALMEALDGVDAVFAPLTTLRSQAMDLLLARIMGLRVALVVPDPLSKAMGQGTMPQLMTVAQTASVMVVPATTNLTFWTMASHAKLVDAQRLGEGKELVEATLKDLAEPIQPPKHAAAHPTAQAAPRPKDPLAPLLKASVGVAKGMQNLKFPPLIASRENPEPPVPQNEEAIRRRIEVLERQLAEAKAELKALEDATD